MRVRLFLARAIIALAAVASFNLAFPFALLHSTNDILGNRTQFTTSGDDPTYKWDELNRMVEFKSAVTWPKSSYVQYQYRADGMRVKKFNNWVDPDETTKYLYDGQMPIADYWTDGTDTLLTKYGFGARGIDVITKVANGGSETFGYPIYDTHGNMVATLARNGSGYTLGNQQSYDVWGGVRRVAGLSNPSNSRPCATVVPRTRHQKSFPQKTASSGQP